MGFRMRSTNILIGCTPIAIRQSLDEASSDPEVRDRRRATEAVCDTCVACSRQLPRHPRIGLELTGAWRSPIAREWE